MNSAKQEELMRHITQTAAILVAFSWACAAQASTKLLSDAQINQMGAEAFQKLKATEKLSTDPVKQKQAQCIVDSLRRVLPPEQQQQAWEVQVFDNPEPNAFALPGGKVGINSGMFGITKNQDEMAAVVGHEIAHVMKEHSNQRVSQQLMLGVGLQFLGEYTGGKTSSQKSKLIMGALGAGAQIGVLLPNSRKQETEADLYGQKIMALAGYNPAKATSLWENMIAQRKKGAPPKILSTHPNPENRIKVLNDNLKNVAPDVVMAQKLKLTPKCF
jgi:predicted Zn-dependent protease